LPQELLWVEDPDPGARTKVVPAGLRLQDVKVGNQVAISAGAVPRFLTKFAHVCGQLGKAETITASAAAQHRLLWIYPSPAKLAAHWMPGLFPDKAE
jgi:hypothetical protein